MGIAQSVLLVEDFGAVRRLTLNRPKVLNALSDELVGRLSAALAEASNDVTVTVLVIRGAGRAFCAGYDLKEGVTTPHQGVAAWSVRIRDHVARMLELFDCPKPIIAEVHGYCLAGGCDLMMMCDLVVASTDALFGEPEIRFGSGVVTMMMPWLVGARRAKELLLTGDDRISAKEALQLGMVNRVVEHEELERETLALAQRVAGLDPLATSLTKRSINRALEMAGLREALWANADIDAILEAALVPDRQEFDRIHRGQGLKAALEWRDAKWRAAVQRNPSH